MKKVTLSSIFLSLLLVAIPAFAQDQLNPEPDKIIARINPWKVNNFSEITNITTTQVFNNEERPEFSFYSFRVSGIYDGFSCDGTMPVVDYVTLGSQTPDKIRLKVTVKQLHIEPTSVIVGMKPCNLLLMPRKFDLDLVVKNFEAFDEAEWSVLFADAAGNTLKEVFLQYSRQEGWKSNF